MQKYYHFSELKYTRKEKENKMNPRYNISPLNIAKRIKSDIKDNQESNTNRKFMTNDFKKNTF